MIVKTYSYRTRQPALQENRTNTSSDSSLEFSQQRFIVHRCLQAYIMNGKGVSKLPDSSHSETSPLLISDDPMIHVASYTDNAGASTIEGSVLYRTEGDGERYDNVPKHKRQLGEDYHLIL